MDWFTAVRYAVFAGVAACAAIAVGDWALRTKQISPFSKIGRLTRGAGDRCIRPVERRLVRAGQNPQQAGWWLVGGALVIGVVLLSIIPGIAGVVSGALGIIRRDGARGVYVVTVSSAYRVLVLALIVRVVASWMPLNTYASWMRPVRFLTEWMLRPLRRHIPPLGVVDVTPLVAWFGLWILSTILLRVA